MEFRLRGWTVKPMLTPRQNMHIHITREDVCKTMQDVPNMQLMLESGWIPQMHMWHGFHCCPSHRTAGAAVQHDDPHNHNKILQPEVHVCWRSAALGTGGGILTRIGLTCQ